MSRKYRFLLMCLAGICSTSAFASFHEMQIEKLLIGVGDDLSAQIVQLRMRASGQGLIHQAKLVAYDHAGQNPVVVVDFNNDVTSGNGKRIAICSPSFLSKAGAAFIPDFVMTNTIPASYRAAGRLTYEQDGGFVFWSLSWGGSAYTGPNSGNSINDDDGDYGPPFPEGLPSSPLDPNYARRSVLTFTGSGSAESTSNSADYVLDSALPVFTNNFGTQLTLELEPDVNSDNAVDQVDLQATVDATLSATPLNGADVSADGLWDGLDVQLMLSELLGPGGVLGDGTNRGSGVQLQLQNAAVDSGAVQVPVKLHRDNLSTETPETITATIAFDPAKLTFVGENDGDDLFDWYAKEADVSVPSPGVLKLIVWGTTFQKITCVDDQRGGANTGATNNPFTLVTLLFTVNAKGGATPLTVESFRMADGTGVPLDAALAQGASVQIGGIAAEDIDGSGEIDAVDVQLVINGALNIDIGAFDADVNGDTAVDAVDVQIVINAALGL